MSLSSKEQNKGFTLTEIIVVVIIVGVLATLVIPRFTGVVERVRAAEGVRLLIALMGAKKAYELENGVYATDPDAFDIKIDRSANFDKDSVNVQNNTANVAEIARRDDPGGDSGYTLSIDENGVISCSDGTSTTFTCAKAGY